MLPQYFSKLISANTCLLLLCICQYSHSRYLCNELKGVDAELGRLNDLGDVMLESGEENDSLSKLLFDLQQPALVGLNRVKRHGKHRHKSHEKRRRSHEKRKKSHERKMKKKKGKKHHYRKSYEITTTYYTYPDRTSETTFSKATITSIATIPSIPITPQTTASTTTMKTTTQPTTAFATESEFPSLDSDREELLPEYDSREPIFYSDDGDAETVNEFDIYGEFSPGRIRGWRDYYY